MPSGVQGTNRGLPCASRPKLIGVESVDILQRRDPLDDRPLVDVPRQGHLDEDAVDGRVGVEPVDRRQQFGLGPDVGRRSTIAVHPGPGAGLLLAADVHLAGRIVADQDDGQAGDDPRARGQLGDLRRHPAADLQCQGFPIDDLSGHRSSLLPGSEIIRHGGSVRGLALPTEPV